MLKNLFAIAILSSISFSLYADASSHFFVQMKNDSEKDVTISFHQGPDKEITLEPTLPDNTPLISHQTSKKYGVNIVPMDPKATFNIVFKGNQDCKLDIGFYAPGRPRVTIEGLGCTGAGFKLIDHGKTLLLYITDIDLEKAITHA